MPSEDLASINRQMETRTYQSLDECQLLCPIPLIFSSLGALPLIPSPSATVPVRETDHTHAKEARMAEV